MLDLISALLNIRFHVAWIIATVCAVLYLWLFPDWPPEYVVGVFVVVMACIMFTGGQRGKESDDR